LLLAAGSVIAAEGDIPIEQVGGSITTQALSGDATITAAGVLSLATGSVGDNEIDYTAVTLADFTNDTGYFDALADFTGTLTDAYLCTYNLAGGQLVCNTAPATFEPAGVTATDITDSTVAGRTLLTAADAAAQRTALSVDAAGTDNSTDVTLAGEDFLSLTGQQITGNAINPDNLASADFGDFTCNGTSCSMDSYTGTLSFATTGTLLGGLNASPKTAATYTVGTDAVTESYGTLFINSDNDAIDFTLPSAVAEMSMCFMQGQGVSGAITVQPAAGDYLVVDSVQQANPATDYVSTGDGADKLCIVAIDATNWIVTSETGTWAE
jgi:hypothetical protein